MRTVQADPYKNRQKAVIFDLDGVLCNNGNSIRDKVAELRAEGREPTDYDWSEFNQGDPHTGWTALARALWIGGFRIIVLTARAFASHAATVTWLSMHDIRYDRLIMRIPEEEVEYFSYKKVETTRLMETYDIVLAVDDHPRHCEVYEALGIPTIHAQ